MFLEDMQVKDTARFFKVLADEARLKMLWLLFKQRELCVCDIMEVLEITQSKASRHLAVLRNAGLAKDRREGLWSYYSLIPAKDEAARAHLKLLRTTLSRRADSRRLLAKLNAWLKAKQGSDSCRRNGRSARAVRNSSDGSAPTYLSGGPR